MPLGGQFNVMNALAALTAADVFGIDPDVAVAGIATTPPVPGRFEIVSEPGVHPFSVVVDYAHTPDALAGVLVDGAVDRAARRQGGGRVRMRRRPRCRQATVDGCRRGRTRRPRRRHVRQPAPRGPAGDHRCRPVGHRTALPWRRPGRARPPPCDRAGDPRRPPRRCDRHRRQGARDHTDDRRHRHALRRPSGGARGARRAHADTTKTGEQA